MQDAGITFAEYASRARARIAEIAAQQADIAALTINGPAEQSATVGQVVAAFTAAGANTTWLPAAPALGVSDRPVTDYNLATWSGNATAYLTCNLGVRGPEYLGRCLPMPVSCTASVVDGAPYVCTRLGTNTTVPGSLANATYRCVGVQARPVAPGPASCSQPVSGQH
jgi:hypothetical protein